MALYFPWGLLSQLGLENPCYRWGRWALILWALSDPLNPYYHWNR